MMMHIGPSISHGEVRDDRNAGVGGIEFGQSLTVILNDCLKQAGCGVRKGCRSGRCCGCRCHGGQERIEGSFVVCRIEYVIKTEPATIGEEFSGCAQEEKKDPKFGNIGEKEGIKILTRKQT
jgi:hypothetical protein